MSAFEHQVAGHTGNILKTENHLLKLETHVESAFYEAAQTTSLTKVMPKYYGRHSKDGKNYIRIENLLQDFESPSIMDIKLGTKLYGLEADEAKKQRMEEQAQTTTSGATGLRICGMKLWNGSKHEYFDRSYGRSLTADTLHEGFERFFKSANDFVIQDLVKQIEEIVAILGTVNCSFGGVSILLIYENNKTCAKLVDFAHAHFVENEDDDVPKALANLKKFILNL